METGVNANMHCVGACGEITAGLKIAEKYGETRLDWAIAVNDSGKIYTPCGRCRDFMSQLDKGNRRTKIVLPQRKIKTLGEIHKDYWMHEKD
jgi:cytidine deaminase